MLRLVFHICQLLSRADRSYISTVANKLAELANKARELQQAGDNTGATSLFKQVLELEPLHVEALVAIGMSEFHSPPTEEKAVERFCLAFEANAYPEPVSVDSEMGYELAARIGHFRASRHQYALAKLWLGRAVRSRVEKQHDCWDVLSSGVLPRVPSRDDELAAIAAFHENMDRLLAKPSLRIHRTSCIESLFFFAYYDIDHKAAAQKYVQLHIKAMPELRWEAPHLRSPRSSDSSRIRIGFLSSFFQPASSIYGSFGHTILRLPRDVFDISFIYFHRQPIEPRDKFLSPNPENDLYLPQLGNRLDTVAKARNMIAAKRLDVLIYLDLFMTSDMHQLAIAKLAPVQAYTHGHPMTSGIPRSIMNYFISWEAAELPDAQERYTEELVLLPGDVAWEYYEPRNTPEEVTLVGGMISWAHYSRTNLDFVPATLSPTSNWYFCAQPAFKYHASFDKILAKILEQDSDATLILMKITTDHHAQMHFDLEKRMAAHGVNMNRVVFLERLLHHRLMAMYKLADVVLDSVYFGGDTTTREAFETGAPVVTLPHKLLGTRWTQAYYKIIGVLDLIAKDADDYVKLAVSVARNKTIALAFRQLIKANVHKLFRRPEAARVWADALLKISPRSPAMLSPAASVQPPQAMFPASPKKSTVRAFDAASLSAIGSASADTLAFVLVEPFGECNACEAMGSYWSTVGQFFDGAAWRLSCRRDSKLCSKLGLRNMLGGKKDPEIAIWSGRQFVFYTGNRDFEALSKFLMSEAVGKTPLKSENLLIEGMPADISSGYYYYS